MPAAPAAPNVNHDALPNPYNYPSIITVETLVNGVFNSVDHEFSDLQQAWCWARDQTGIHDFPFHQSYGEHAGWEFMSFPFTKHEMEAHPEDEYEIFSFTAEDGSKTNYVIGYKDEDFEEEEDDDEEEEEVAAGAPPPAGSPGPHEELEEGEVEEGEVFGPATNLQPPPAWGLAGIASANTFQHPFIPPLPLPQPTSHIPSVTAEDCFAAVGLNPHSSCPHGLPSYACMPCSH